MGWPGSSFLQTLKVEAKRKLNNAVATIVVARWEGALDHGKLDAALAGRAGVIEGE